MYNTPLPVATCMCTCKSINNYVYMYVTYRLLCSLVPRPSSLGTGLTVRIYGTLQIKVVKFSFLPVQVVLVRGRRRTRRPYY